jgi:hypothetical protein
MTFDLTTKNWQLPSAYVKTNNSPCGLWEIPNKINWAVDSGEVVLLISQAGAVGSSTFVNTAKNKIITPTNATWSNNKLLFGKPTIYCNSGYLRIDDVADYNFNTGQQFCIEFYFIPVGSAYCSLLGRESTAVGTQQNIMNLSHDYATGSNLYAQGILSVLSTVTVPYILNSRWSHIAITRDSSGLIRFFANGSLVKSGINSAGISSSYPLFFGAAGGYSNNSYPSSTGYFAEIRIVKDNPVYTSNFTVMNEAFIS